MATETAARGSRPSLWLLALLGAVLLMFLWSQMFSGRSAPPTVSTGSARAPGAQQPGKIDPAELDIKIESLQQTPAGPAAGERNPFRFQPKAPPRPPPGPPRPMVTGPPVTQVPQGPAPPAPIGTLIKFIGIVETGREKIGAFSDCRYTFSGRDGEVIEGRFRVVRIGVESAIVEYADGRGRTTLPLNGQACVVK